MRELLSALWSFLQHPAVHVEEHVAAVEARLKSLEARLVGDLEAVKNRVVEDLKRELHRVLLMLALAMGCAALALTGMIFGLMAAWTDLKGFIGPGGASLVLAVAFLLASLVVSGVLRSVRRRSQLPPHASKIAT